MSGAVALAEIAPTPAPPQATHLRWPRTVLRTPDLGGEFCPPVLDVTGRSRILVYGPLVAVPAGLWRLTCRFSLCAEAASYPYRLQFGQGEDMAREFIPPSGPGLYEVIVDHAWAAERVTELRLSLLRPAFHGDLRFEEAVVERIGEAIG